MLVCTSRKSESQLARYVGLVVRQQLGYCATQVELMFSFVSCVLGSEVGTAW